MANSAAITGAYNVQTTQSLTKAITRLGGYDKYDTAVLIADHGWSSATTAVLAPSGDLNMVDALASASLAKAVDGPILLVDKDAVPASTLAELQKLGVTKVYLASGTAVISSEVDSQLTTAGIQAVRLGGVDQYATAVNIAKELYKIKPFQEVVVAKADACVDAISIAPIAAALGMPILLVDKNSVPTVVTDYINTSGITKTYVIGGTAVVSDAVKEALPNPMRLSGNDRYDTNTEVLKQFKDLIVGGSLFFANGSDTSLIDSLAGGPMAAKLGSAIVLSHKDAVPDGTKAFIKAEITVKEPVILGGTAVMSDSAVQNLEYAQPGPVAPVAPAVTRDDIANTVSGMALGMEYKLYGAMYFAYNPTIFALLDLSGAHTLMVRVAANGINPPSAPTTLIFTPNPLTVNQIAEAAVAAYEAAPIDTLAHIAVAEGLKAPADLAVASVTDATLKTALELRISNRTTAIATAKAALVVPAQSITLNKDRLILLVGHNETLVPTILPSDATNSVTWMSDMPGVATVDSAGKVVAVALGMEAMIMVTTADGKFSSTCSVLVLNDALAAYGLTQAGFPDMAGLITSYGPALGLDLTAYNALSMEGQSAVQSALLAPVFNTVSEFQAALTAAVIAQHEPSAPAVTSNDTTNTVSGMAIGMEYGLDGDAYVAYDQVTFDALDLSGAHTLLVRIAAQGVNPPSAPTELSFTPN